MQGPVLTATEDNELRRETRRFMPAHGTTRPCVENSSSRQRAVRKRRRVHLAEKPVVAEVAHLVPGRVRSTGLINVGACTGRGALLGRGQRDQRYANNYQDRHAHEFST